MVLRLTASLQQSLALIHFGECQSGKESWGKIFQYMEKQERLGLGGIGLQSKLKFRIRTVSLLLFLNQAFLFL